MSDLRLQGKTLLVYVTKVQLEMIKVPYQLVALIVKAQLKERKKKEREKENIKTPILFTQSN